MAGASEDSERPSYAELEALVVEQAALIDTLRARVAEQAAVIEELQAEGQPGGSTVNSGNSSMPRSSDPPKSRAERRPEARAKLKELSKRKPGGQPGHEARAGRWWRLKINGRIGASSQV